MLKEKHFCLQYLIISQRKKKVWLYFSQKLCGFNFPPLLKIRYTYTAHTWKFVLFKILLVENRKVIRNPINCQSHSQVISRGKVCVSILRGRGMGPKDPSGTLDLLLELEVQVHS